jgi:sulfur-oxidizing protein SoxX
VAPRVLGAVTVLALLAWPAAASPAAAGEAARGTGAGPAGDAARGAAIVASRTQGLCVLCHAVPGVPAVHAGTIGPPLEGIGARLAPEALRERLLAPERFNPQTVMPSYARTEGLERVAPARRGRPILDPQQVEDVVAYLAGLR